MGPDLRHLTDSAISFMPSVTETTLRFTGGYPPLPVLALAFGLAALMWWLYGRESRFGGGALAKLPALLRSLAVFVLVMALAGPVLPVPPVATPVA